MEFIKIVVFSVLVGVIFVGITNQFSSTKYPPCDLVARGIGVSTFGCSNDAGKNEPCNNLTPNSSEISKCIGANYYAYKTFPFGFKQTFGPHSNLNDQAPKRKNEVASFALGFVLAAVISTLLYYRSPLAKRLG